MKMTKIYKAALVLLSAASLALPSCSKSEDVNPNDNYTESGMETYQLESFELSFPVSDKHSALYEALDDNTADVQLLLSGEESTHRVVMRATLSQDGENFKLSSEGDNIGKLSMQKYLLVGVHFAETSEALVEWVGEHIGTIKNIGLILSPLTDCSGVSLSTSYDPDTGIYGTGTEGDPYLLHSTTDVDDLIRAKLDAGDCCDGLCYKMATSLIVGDWVPLGSASHYFNGHFDGSSDTGGYSIKYLQYSGLGNYFGFFYGLAENSSISNLDFDNVSIAAGSYAGALSAQGGSNSVTNVSVSGTIKGTGGFLGGLFGCGFGNLTNCTSTVNISSTAASSGVGIGGLVGYSSPGIALRSCRSAAVVSGSKDNTKSHK